MRWTSASSMSCALAGRSWASWWRAGSSAPSSSRPSQVARCGGSRSWRRSLRTRTPPRRVPRSRHEAGGRHRHRCSDPCGSWGSRTMGRRAGESLGGAGYRPLRREPVQLTHRRPGRRLRGRGSPRPPPRASPGSVQPVQRRGIAHGGGGSGAGPRQWARGSRPFDTARDGFVMAEGAAILVLEEREAALRRGAAPIAELVGFGASNDAYHLTAPLPSGEAAAAAITAALRDAAAEPEEIGYVNAHGSSTQLNEIAEAKALHLALGEWARTVPVSGTKGLY